MDLETGRIHHFDDEIQAAMAQLKNPNLVSLHAEEVAALEKVPAENRREELRSMREKALADLRGPLRP
jgi:hypothetical protein